MGLAGIVVLGLFAAQRAALTCSHRAGGVRHTLAGSLALFRQPAILMCFGYFLISTMATSGLTSFTPTVLDAAFAIPLAMGASALTAYLLGSTAGIVAGGVFATRTARHDRIAGAGLLAAALLVALIASSAAARVALLPLFALTGFALGCTGPSRDLIVRGATPAGAAGRVYGFVYSGLDVGGVVGPLAFGFLLDHGAAREVLYAVAACFVARDGHGADRAAREGPGGAVRRRGAAAGAIGPAYGFVALPRIRAISSLQASASSWYRSPLRNLTSEGSLPAATAFRCRCSR